MHHLEDNDILFANQLEFRKNNSSESQLILTVEDLSMNLDHGDQIDMIILDFSKAFDKHPINASLANCSFMAFREVPLLGLFLSSLVDDSVIIDGMCSQSVDVT